MTQKIKGPAMAATIDRPGSQVDNELSHKSDNAAWQATTDLSVQDHEWLTSHGVSPSAIIEPWPIRSARVQFDGLHGFDFATESEQALVFKAEDRREQIDFIAWERRTGNLASWYGNAFCLGDVDDIFNPATYFAGDALRLHETSLDWLRADRDGIVILCPELVPAYLANCQRVRCSNVSYARKVEKWLQPHKPKVEILVEVEERGAA